MAVCSPCCERHVEQRAGRGAGAAGAGAAAACDRAAAASGRGVRARRDALRAEFARPRAVARAGDRRRAVRAAVALARRAAGGRRAPRRGARARAAHGSATARWSSALPRAADARRRWPQQLGITPTQLNRVCRQRAGHTRARVLHARLMLEAQRDLAYTHAERQADRARPGLRAMPATSRASSSACRAARRRSGAARPWPRARDRRCAQAARAWATFAYTRPKRLARKSSSGTSSCARSRAAAGGPAASRSSIAQRLRRS